MNAHLKTVVELYTGCKVINLETVPDPQVRDVTAVRADLAAGAGTIYFLVDQSLAEVTELDLCEVEFTCWPPVSR